MDIKNNLIKNNQDESSSQEISKKCSNVSRNFFRIAPIIFFIITVLLLGILVGGVVGLHVPLVLSLAGVSALLSLVTGGVFLFIFFIPGKKVSPVEKLLEFNPFKAIPEELSLPELHREALEYLHDLHETVWQACAGDRSLEVVRSELKIRGLNLVGTENWKDYPVFTSTQYPGIVFKSISSKCSVERKCQTYLRTVKAIQDNHHFLIRIPKIRVIDEMITTSPMRESRYLIAEESLDCLVATADLSPDEAERCNYAVYCQKGDKTTLALMQLLELMRELLLYDVSYSNCPILQSTGPEGEVVIGILDPIIQILPDESSLYSPETVCIKFIQEFIRNESQLEQLKLKILDLFPFRSVRQMVVQRYIELKVKKGDSFN